MPTLGVLDALKALTPTKFENVVYDLATYAGLRNAVWRTPGADGGRDIEGEFATTDFSGFSVVARWYIECKRYAASVDWPTVWQKAAYADSHSADYLLVVTTALLSPQCKTEISSWNAQKRRPAIRFWEGHTLEQMLMLYPAILVKHGVVADPKLIPPSFMALAQETSKVVQAAYGLSEVLEHDNPALESASAMGELLTVRIRDAETIGRASKSSFSIDTDGYSWITFTGAISQLVELDKYSLRAILATLRHVTGLKSATADVVVDTIRVHLPDSTLLNPAAMTLLAEIAVWGDLEVRVEGQDFMISWRK